MKISKLKTKKPRKFNNANSFCGVCPACLSPLITNSKGYQICSGERLKIWEKEFKKYKMFSKSEKEKFLKLFDDSEKFLEMFNKWDYVDESGNRVNFVCEES